MAVSDDAGVQIHDLLEIDPDSLSAGEADPPSWVREATSTTCWVVVRRGFAPDGQISVGVRGRSREERWAAFCWKSGVRSIVRPEDLLDFEGRRRDATRMPAIRALTEIVNRWSAVALAWGPIGSVGFELATGRPVITQASDLDLVLHAPLPISRTLAVSLLRQTEGLPVGADIRVETPACGFSLEEFARSSGSAILVRRNDGFSLSRDPWSGETARREAAEAAIAV
jgi:phosphoribosyl-dephospho-CoA transferase